MYATDQCGMVGKNHTSALVTVKSSDVYSIYGYHHEFADVGYSFNFQDLNTVPSATYYASLDAGGGGFADPTTSIYSCGRDYINGLNNIDFGTDNYYCQGDALNGSASTFIWQSLYRPTLLLPTQIRSLDTAW